MNDERQAYLLIKRSVLCSQIEGMQLEIERIDTELGRKNSRQSKGGKARAEALTATRRSEIAKAAADARWGNPLPTQIKAVE